MKLIVKIGLGALATAALLVSGCSAQSKPAEQVAKPTIDETQLGYRNVSLYDEKDAATPKVEYHKNAPGSGVKFKRAFQDAPPMIPHDTEGMLPITKNNNACLGCHMPEVASAMGATPIPVSHFTNFRPQKSIALEGRNTSDGTLQNVSIKKQDHLYQGRFNCSQCHAPQANVAPLVDSVFKAEYKKPDGEFKSSWDDTEFMKDIDTTK